ncbi:MAG: DUF202 domain-containing protein [Micromonosporaceae bacterium]
MPEHEPQAAPADDMEDMDPGLARERTELAWVRTAIAFAALGGAILKVNPAVGFPVLATSAVVWAIGRVARRPGRPGAPRGERRGLLLMITVAVTLVSLVALVVALVGVRSPLPSP